MTKTVNQIKITHIKAKYIKVVWEAAQRPFDQKHADYIAENFDPELFDPISVTKANEHGIHHPIRGQHRTAAFKKVFGEEQMIPCIVVESNDEVSAADFFLHDAESHQPLKTVDRFLVAVTARRADEVAIKRIVEQCGYQIGNGVKADTICAVDALMSVYKKHGASVLRQTLRTLHSTWGTNHDSIRAGFIRGYGEFLAAYMSQVNFDILHGCMAKRRVSPGNLLAEADHEITMRRDIVKNVAGAVSYAIFGIYNSCAGRKKLQVAEPATKEKSVEPTQKQASIDL